ncbi:MAG: hypothetical protein HYZ22_02920 [Chloroflexi bacterium]|nr:hypothetical protein [Chloroflexota bacterium]
MTKVATLLPAFRLSIEEIDNVITQLPKDFEPPLIALNDDEDTIAQYLYGLMKAHQIRLLHIPYQVGKTEALRQGLKSLLEESDADVIVQLDGRSKQPAWQLAPLVEILYKQQVDMIIGDRYAKQSMVGQDHRKAGAGLMSNMVRHLTGYELLDAACGTRAYVRELAARFLHLRCFGYGAEVEQLLIAAIHSCKVSSYPLETKRQADSTNTEKIEDSVFALLNYANELEMSDTVRSTLSFILSQLKRRKTFDVDLSVFGVDRSIRLKYVGVQEGIVDAYTDQLPRDAYTALKP